VDPGQYKPGAPKSSFVPALCEVCRNRPVAMIVVDFIFACNQRAKRIEAAIWHRRDERLLAVSPQPDSALIHVERVSLFTGGSEVECGQSSRRSNLAHTSRC
jgi:hypothetical protein